VRSYGDPYFAAVQGELAYMDRGNAPRSVSPGGQVSVQIDLTIESLPVKLATDDETHALFSYHEYGGGVERLWLGLSPSGRLIGGWQGITGNAYELSSGSGLVLPDGRLHRIDFTTVEDGSGLLQWDGSAAAEAAADASRTWDEIGPSVGYLGRFSIFNGLESLSRCACTIRRAQVGFDEGVIEWAMEERTGVTLAGESEQFTNADFDLTIQRYNPLIYPLAWGALSDDDVQAAFRWYRKTIYTRQTRTKTKYSRVA